MDCQRLTGTKAIFYPKSNAHISWQSWRENYQAVTYSHFRFKTSQVQKGQRQVLTQSPDHQPPPPHPLPMPAHLLTSSPSHFSHIPGPATSPEPHKHAQTLTPTILGLCSPRLHLHKSSPISPAEFKSHLFQEAIPETTPAIRNYLSLNSCRTTGSRHCRNVKLGIFPTKTPLGLQEVNDLQKSVVSISP